MALAHTTSGEYRPEIDGLRAVAVLAVILFHVDPRWLPGGFVGVDMFFVISGYLITGIVSRELHEGRFTFRRFYERRIRRILPALWVLLIICVPISWLLMLPQDAEPMGKSALWSVLAMANVYFWHEVSTDYFAPQSAQLCTGAPCPLTDPQGRYLYSDASHLSVHGSRHLAAELIRSNRMPDFAQGILP